VKLPSEMISTLLSSSQEGPIARDPLLSPSDRPKKRRRGCGTEVRFLETCKCTTYGHDEAVTAERIVTVEAVRTTDGPKEEALALEESFLGIRRIWSYISSQMDPQESLSTLFKRLPDETARGVVSLCRSYVSHIVEERAMMQGCTISVFATSLYHVVVKLLQKIRDSGKAALLPSTIIINESENMVLFLLRRCLLSNISAQSKEDQATSYDSKRRYETLDYPSLSVQVNC